MGQHTSGSASEPVLERDDVDARLRHAMAERRLPDELDELTRRPLAAITPEARELVDRADAATTAISARCRAAADGVEAALDGAGVRHDTTAVPPRLAFSVITVRVPAGAAEAAVQALERAGYAEVPAPTAAARRGREWLQRSTWLVADDEQTTRVHLRWGRGGRVRRRLPKPPADVLHTPLPGPAWPLYFALHASRRVTRGAQRSEPTSFGPFLGTPIALIDPLLDLAGVGEGDVVLDLGCGDGRVVVRAAERHGCRARGIEHDPDLVARGRRAITERGLDGRVELVEGDLATADPSEASVVFLFLPPDQVARLLPRLLSSLPTGGRVIAHEQLATRWPTPPDRSELVIGGGITVAHVWSAGTGERGDAG